MDLALGASHTQRVVNTQSYVFCIPRVDDDRATQQPANSLTTITPANHPHLLNPSGQTLMITVKMTFQKALCHSLLIFTCV